MKKTLAVGLLAAAVVTGSFLSLPAEARGCHHHRSMYNNYNSYNAFNYANPYVNPYANYNAYNPYVNYNAYANPYVNYNPYYNGNTLRNIWNRIRFGF